jgi:hypothetical protein
LIFKRTGLGLMEADYPVMPLRAKNQFLYGNGRRKMVGEDENYLVNDQPVAAVAKG